MRNLKGKAGRFTGLGLVLGMLLAGNAARADMMDQFNQMQKMKVQPPSNNPTTSANQATVRAMHGTVNVRGNKGDKWQPVQAGAGLNAGDTIQTGGIGSAAELGFMDGSVIRMGYNTSLTLNEGQQRGLRLLLGKLWSRIVHGTGGLSVRTPSAVASILGTDFGVSLDNSNATTLSVNEGTVEVTGASGKKVRVGAGTFTTVYMNKPPTAPRSIKFLKDYDSGTGLAIDSRVAITNPDIDARVRGRQVIEVLVDPGVKQINYVEFSVDGQVQYMANVAPYRFQLDSRTLSNGRHVLQAIAYWSDRDITISKEVPIAVQNDLAAKPSAAPVASPAANK